MACAFTIGFTGTAESLVEHLKNKILTNNGSFGGDDSSGNFSIHVLAAAIEGAYTINGNDIMITIRKKPFFLKCNSIRDYVAQNLTGQA
jgi:hypothetical protein